MPTANKLMMITLGVSDMPKAKAFYTDNLGFKVTTDYRQDDDNWYVTLELPEGGATITLSTHHDHMKPGSLTAYFEASDVAAAHEELAGKGVTTGEVQDDLFGPGSGVKWFNLEDPDGNVLFLVQAHPARSPF